MKRERKPKLSFEQLEALLTYARTEGKNWRNTLRHSWMTGIYGSPHREYSGILQQIKNKFGTSWVADFKTPKKRK
jgi:hypothetical protein